MRRTIALVALLGCWLALSASARAGVGPYFPSDRVDGRVAATSAAGVTTEVWSEHVSGGFVTEGRRVDAAGVPTGGGIVLSAAGRLDSEPVAAVGNAAGDTLVVMSQGGFASPSLVGRIWKADGTLGAQQTIEAGVSSAAAVVSDPAGADATATLIWSTYDTESHVSAARWKLSTAAPDAPVALSGNSENAVGPQAAAYDTGVAITWTDLAPIGSFGSTVEALRWPLTGAPGAEVAVSGVNDNVGPSGVASNPAGDLFVAWSPQATGTRAAVNGALDQLDVARWPHAAAAPTAGTPVSADADTAVGGALRGGDADSYVNAAGPHMTVSSAGDAIVAWGATHGCANRRYGGGTNACAGTRVTSDHRELRVTSGGTVGAEHTLDTAVTGVFADSQMSIAIDGADLTTLEFSSPSPVTQPEVLRIAADGTPGSLARVDTTFKDYGGLALGVAANNSVTLSWSHGLVCDGDIRDAVWTAISAKPGVPHVVSGDNTAEESDLVTHTTGDDAIVTGDRCSGDGTAQAQFRPWPAGGALGTPHALTAAGSEVQGAPSAAADASGRTTIAWVDLDSGELTLHAVRVSADGSAGVPVVLASGSAMPTAPAVAITPSGDATIVWDQFDGTQTTVHGARWPSAGAPAAPTAISTSASATYPDDVTPAVAVDTAGTATVIWTETYPTYTDGYGLFGSEVAGGGYAQARRWHAAGSFSAVAAASDATSIAVGVAVTPGGAATIAYADASSALVTKLWRWPAAAAAPDSPVAVAGGGVPLVPVVDAAGDVFEGVPYATGDGNRDVGLYEQAAGASSFAGPFDVSPPGNYFARLAADPAGDVAVTSETSRTDDPDNDTAIVTVRFADGTTCAPTTLGDVGSNISTPSATLISATTGDAVWERFDGANDQVQSARFTPRTCGAPAPTPSPTPGPSPKPTPSPTVAPTPAAVGPEAAAALACAGAQIKLVTSEIHGSKVTIYGAAVAALIGKPVSVTYVRDHKVVGQTVVGAAGLFTVTVPLPGKADRDEGDSRYTATAGGQTSTGLKLTRRENFTKLTTKGKKVIAAGRVTGRFPRHAKVTLSQRVSCTKHKTVARTRLDSHGRWKATFAAPTAAVARVAVYRARTTILDRHRKPIVTYTLPQPAA